MATNERPTKAERRAASRERARQLQAEQERRAKRNKMLAIIGSVVGLLVVVGVVAYIIISGMRGPMDDFEGTRPANTEDHGQIVVGANGAGSPNEGAPEVEIYADYMCHYCYSLEQVNAADLEHMVDSGEGTLVLRPVSYLDRSGNFSGFSSTGMEALAIVADAEPELVLDAHAALFTLHELALSGIEIDDQMIIDTLVSAGVSQETAERVRGDEYNDWIRAVSDQAQHDGISGTPTVFVDGEEFTGWGEAGALYTAVTGNEPPANAPEESESEAPSGE